jgi:sugar phosphate isomerase/epimerase
MPKLKIGLSMLYMLSESFDKMANELGKAETNFVEIVDDGTHTLSNKRVQTLREAAKSYDLKYSVHAPFADINVASPSKAMLKASKKRLRQSMQFAVDLDAYLWVFHPGGKSGISAFYPDADWKQNVESIIQIHKWAVEYGLKIAMENLPEKYNFLMKTPQDFQRFYEATGLEDIGIVLDTGHAHLEGQITPFLHQVPNKIAHIHISDNHGVIDEHLGLGYGTIHWDQFAADVKKTGFSGTILDESVFQAKETLQKLKILFT